MTLIGVGHREDSWWMRLRLFWKLVLLVTLFNFQVSNPGNVTIYVAHTLVNLVYMRMKTYIVSNMNRNRLLNWLRSILIDEHFLRVMNCYLLINFFKNKKQKKNICSSRQYLKKCLIYSNHRALVVCSYKECIISRLNLNMHVLCRSRACRDHSIVHTRLCRTGKQGSAVIMWEKKVYSLKDKFIFFFTERILWVIFLKNLRTK